MGDRDRFGMRDGVEATISVPEGEESRVAGLEPVVEEEPTSPQPADVPFEVREVPGKGFGVFVPTQKAPVTIANVTWFSDQAAADTGLESLRRTFGWVWIPARYEVTQREEEVDGPYGPETKTVQVRGAKISDGRWENKYHLVFDPASLAELGMTGGSR